MAGRSGEDGQEFEPHRRPRPMVLYRGGALPTARALKEEQIPPRRAGTTSSIPDGSRFIATLNIADASADVARHDCHVPFA
jgi:hypothetical protein